MGQVYLAASPLPFRLQYAVGDDAVELESVLDLGQSFLPGAKDALFLVGVLLERGWSNLWLPCIRAIPYCDNSAQHRELRVS